MRNLLILFFVLLVGNVYANKEECYKLYSQQNYKMAINQCTLSANAGDVKSQFILGVIYSQGIGGIKLNYSLAIKWHKKAANQGDMYAQNILGCMYYLGLGLKKDYNQAYKWYKKAANQGCIAAENMLGLMYYQGHGVKQDYKQSYKWYKKAASHGDSNAQHEIERLPQLKQYYVNENKDLSAKKVTPEQSIQEDVQESSALSILKGIYSNYSPIELFFYSIIIVVLSVVISILLIKLVNIITKPKHSRNIVNNQMISRACKWIASCIITVTFFNIYIGMLEEINSRSYYILDVIFTIVEVLAYFMLCAKVDKIFNTVLKRLYLIPIYIGAVYAILCYIIIFILDKLPENGLYTYIAAVCMVAAIFIMTCIVFITLSAIFYKIGEQTKIIGYYTDNRLFIYSGKCMQVGTYLLPILIGFIPIFISIYLFLIACIISKCRGHYTSK